MFEKLGSYDFTSGAIEEAGEIKQAAFDVLKSRVGRCLNDKYGILGKILLTANPKKNFIYSEFYIPWKNRKLPKTHAFIQSFVTDNPYIEKEYIQNLREISNKIRRDRLLHGMFEYDLEGNSLIKPNAVEDLFVLREHVRTGINYITADIARFGSDRTAIILWDGYMVEQIWLLDQSSITDTANLIQDIQDRYLIPSVHVVADEEGLGGGVVDLAGCMGFVGGSRPIPTIEGRENLVSLKDQCYFKLADLINARKISINPDNAHLKEQITEELEITCRIRNPDSDGKLSVVRKDQVKEALGRSPDLADAMMMRVYLDILIPVGAVRVV